MNLTKILKRTAPIGLLAAALLGLTACGGVSDPTVTSDSDQSYGLDAEGEQFKIPTDTKAYLITGEVVSSVNTVSRQTSPAQGEMYGSAYGASGTFYGETVKGKGMVRLLVKTASPSTTEAQPGNVSILKVADTKGSALLPGDVVSVKCRRQFEAIAAVQENQKFDEKRDGTWELDYCRLVSPVVAVTPLKAPEVPKEK